MEFLLEGLLGITWKTVVMWALGALLIYLAIRKEMEPTLLLPIGFGAILVNIPGVNFGALQTLYDAGIANELFPLLLFIGIGAMIDFGPLLSNPKLMIFGAAAQFGIFMTLCLASIFFDINDAASIAIIGAADGPSAIAVAIALGSKYLGAIMVAAYSYMALVPIIQPPIIKLLTTKKERRIRMEYKPATVSKRTRILFPIVILMIAALVAPGFRRADFLPDVRQSDSGVWGTQLSVGNSTERAGQPGDHFPGNFHCISDGGGKVLGARDAVDPGIGTVRLRV